MMSISQVLSGHLVRTSRCIGRMAPWSIYRMSIQMVRPHRSSCPMNDEPSPNCYDMKKITLLCFLLALHSAACAQTNSSLTTYSKFDFVPGEKILFYEDFS